jgi:hypothetical protein
MNQNEAPITFRNFCDSYKYPTMGALRKMAYTSEFNGFKPAFLKIGRRRLILPDTLFRLLREKGSK